MNTICEMAPETRTVPTGRRRSQSGRGYSSRYPESETLNPHPEIRNPKLETRQPTIQTPKLEKGKEKAGNKFDRTCFCRPAQLAITR